MCQSQSLSPTSLLHSLVSLGSLDHLLLVFRTFPTLLSANPSLDAWTFTPAVPGVLLPVSSPRASAFPETADGSALSCKSPHNDFRAGPLYRSCSHSLMFRPPGLLATQVVPTAAPIEQSGRDVYFRAPYELLPPHTSDMLAVRFRAIDGRGLPPH